MKKLKRCLTLLLSIVCVLVFTGTAMGIRFTSGGLKTVYKNAAPTAADNAYPVPYMWLDQTNDKSYILVDVTAGVADWNEFGGVGAESDPIVGAITGIVEADGGGNISAATAGVDYLAPAGSGAALSGIPLDADFGSNGIMERTGAGTYGIRALLAGDIPDLSGTYATTPLSADLATASGISIDFTNGTGTAKLEYMSETGLAGGRITLGLHETNSRIFGIGDVGDMSADWGLSAASDPTLAIASPGGSLPVTITYQRLNSNHNHYIFQADREYFYYTADLTAGSTFIFDQANAAYELTDTDGEQSVVEILGEVAQGDNTGTWRGLKVNPDITTEDADGTGSYMLWLGQNDIKYFGFQRRPAGGSDNTRMEVVDADGDSTFFIGYGADDQPAIDTDGDTFYIKDPFRSKFSTVEESADAATLTVAECSGTLVTNRGWDGNDDQTFTLPDADTVVGAGLKFKFLAVVASGSTADTYFDTEGSTTKIYLDGTAGTDGHRIWFQEVAVGESIVCHTATIDGTTYDWYCDSINGVCADKGS